MEKKVTKANQMLVMFQRNVHVALKTAKETAYNTFVQPHLVYAWSP